MEWHPIEPHLVKPNQIKSNQCNAINSNQHPVKSHQKLELNQLRTHQSPMGSNYQTKPNELGPIRIKLNQLEPPQIELNTTPSQWIESTIINPTKVERNTIKSKSINSNDNTNQLTSNLTHQVKLNRIGNNQTKPHNHIWWQPPWQPSDESM